MKPIISIIIPCYNSDKFIAHTIESVLANTSDLFDIEVIAINDGSTDLTLQILQKYSDKIVIIDKCNGGACRARNAGIRASNGNFIAFCDHDDLWEPNKLELQLAQFNNSMVGLVCSDADTFNDDGVLIRSMAKMRPLKNGMVFYDLLFSNFIVQSSVIVKREVFEDVGLFDDEIFPAEDLELWLRITYKWHINYVDKVLVHYRISNTMYSKDKYRMQNARIPIIKKYSMLVPDESKQNKIMSNAIYAYALDCWYNRDFELARGKFRESFALDRTHIISAVYCFLCFLPASFLHVLLAVKKVCAPK